MNKDEQEKQQILISRYLDGSASQNEILKLKEWLTSSRDNFLYFQQLKNLWDNSEKTSLENSIDVKSAFNKVSKRAIAKNPVKSFWYQWQKIAAILLIPLILGNIIYYTVHSVNREVINGPIYNELFAAFGTRSVVKLSDGTTVWLNSGSSLRYPDRFAGNKRNVVLKGEAYFEVESNPEKPFIVETPMISVKATGTKFNVSVYPNAEEEGVTLVSGKVEVVTTNRNNTEARSELEPNQHLSFSKTSGTSTIITTDVSKYISWKDGKLIFRNEPLSVVTNRLSQVFNVDIEIKGGELKNYSYRATFQDESLADILKLLKISAPIDYMEVRRDPLPDGSFPRKKVLIYPSRQKAK
jgi:transmembrane sensor